MIHWKFQNLTDVHASALVVIKKKKTCLRIYFPHSIIENAWLHYYCHSTFSIPTERNNLSNWLILSHCVFKTVGFWRLNDEVLISLTDFLSLGSVSRIIYSSLICVVQSTLVISKSKGPSKTVRDIHTSTYQICSIEEKKTIWTTKFYKWLCNLTPLIRNIYWKYCGKGEKLLPRSNFSSFPQYFITWF